MSHVDASNPRPSSSPGPVSIASVTQLIALMAAALIVRLPFISPHLFQSDPINYAWGALISGVAHPPGYSGYCFLAWLVNLGIHDINRAFVAINLTAGLFAIPVVYFVGREIGLTEKACLLAAAAFAFSINTLWATTCAVNHACEALGASAFVLLALRAIKRHSLAYGLAAGITLAVFGAIRPTTTYFLVPLWGYMIVRACRDNARALLLNIVVFAAICFAWHRVNEVLMERAGYGGATFAVQAMMPAGHEYASLTATPAATEWSASFHMPMFEVAAWIEDQFGVRFLSRPAGLPPPRLGRACTLAAIQFMKLCYFLLFSAPLLVVVPVAWAMAPRSVARPTREMLLLFGLWIVPVAIFFVVGHLGALGYLQVILSGVVLFVAGLLDEKSSEPAEWRPSNIAQLAAAGCVAAGLAFFVIGRPTYAKAGAGQAADLLALQYTGHAIRDGYAISRATIGNADSRQIPKPIRDARTDDELIRVFKQMNFTATPVLANPSGATAD